MRRIAITVTVLALVAGAFGCSSDAPTPPKTGGPGGGPTGSTALQIRLFTSNPNPPAGTCTLIQAIVTLNGVNVADGTGVVFSTDFGVFGQNGLPLISVVTQNGSAVTALCSDFTGTAVVRATSTVGSESASATITIAFQPSATAGPFVSFCSPSFGPNTGGTVLTINGGRFFGSAGTTRVEFTAGGITREALVTALTASTITVQTPGFPELTAPSVPVDIRVTLGANTAAPVTLSLPNCFAFGTETTTATPVVTAVLPASGVNEGNTRVTIIGSGFDAVGGVQVFFGEVEATIVSVSFNQIVVLTPVAFGSGRDNLNQQVDVRVRNIRSGLEATLTGGYRYTQPLQLISIAPTEERLDQPLTPVTIFGHGFQAPVAVTFDGRAATVISVSESELVVLPARPLDPECNNITLSITVTNINTGDTASGLSFTFIGGGPNQLDVTFISPTAGAAETVVTVNGTNLPSQPQDAAVRFGNILATVSSSSVTELTVVAPDQPGLTNPVCPVGVSVDTLVDVPGGSRTVTVENVLTGCSDSATFQYQLPCVPVTPTPTSTPSPTPTPTPPPGADLAIVKVDDADPVPSTTNVTYTLTITNNGPGVAVNTVMNDPLPAGTTFVSCGASLGNCSGPNVGENGTVTATLAGDLGPGGSITVTIVANVTAGAGTVLSNTATVASDTADGNAGNNSDTETTSVGAPPP